MTTYIDASRCRLSPYFGSLNGVKALQASHTAHASHIVQPNRHSVRFQRHSCTDLSSRASSDKDSECLPQKAAKYSAYAAGLAAAVGFLVIACLPSEGRVMTERFGQENPARSSDGRSGPRDPLRQLTDSSNRTSSDTEASTSNTTPIRQQVSEVMDLSKQAKEAAKAGDFQKALERYSLIAKRYPDLAISNYAKVGRALMLYQVGSVSEALLELEDLEVSLRGYAEVHAALASILYVERPSERAYAEEQFDLASEFDSRYLNVDWVSREKGWPPAMMSALDKFAALK